MLIIKKVTFQNKEYEIIVSDDAQMLLQKQKEGAIVIYLEKEGSTSYSFSYSIQDLEALEDEEYLVEVVIRTLGIPKVIISSAPYILRELCERDVKDLLALYKENEKNPSVEPFFQTEEEGIVYLRDYRKYVYALGRDGIYGIFLRDYSGQNEFMETEGTLGMEEFKREGATLGMEESAEIFAGLAGFTEKEEGKELSYALLKRYQGQGIMYDICRQLLSRQKGRVFVRVQKDNERALHLAEKLGIETLCTGN